MKIDDSILNLELFSPVCSGCRHLQVDVLKGGASCPAFQSIPPEIWNGDHDHKKPFPGDKGIVFEPIEGISNERV